MSTARPFLKWAGGKTRLLPQLIQRVPDKFGTYYEPFLGGGALFFALKPASAVLSDTNLELIRTYRTVRDNVEEVIERLEGHERDHAKFGGEHFQAVRAMDWRAPSPAGCAARMIYLNKVCFNGLYRVNKTGQFNSPLGKFKRPPTICDADNLRACSAALQKAAFREDTFSLATADARPGDFVYFDPPYLPTSKTAMFTAYTADGFGTVEHLRLAALAAKLKRGGVGVLLSNAGLPIVRTLYEFGRMKVEGVAARRNINRNAAKRGAVKEFLIS